MVTQQDAVKFGLGVEHNVMLKLNEMGIKTRPAPGHSPHDLELENGTRIEIKTRVSTSDKTSDGRNLYRFILCRPGITPKDRAEIFILLIHNEMFIIPSSHLSTSSSLAIPYPAGNHRSKWSLYHNRFDLLREFVTG